MFNIKDFEIVSIIIPNYNGSELLKSCIESLIKESNYVLDLIIIDNASTDNSVNYLKNLKQSNNVQYRFIINKENLGFAVAVNQGISLAKGEFICLLNNDIEVSESFISNMIACIKSNSNIFSVSSKMIQFHNRKLIDDAGDEYNLLAWTKKVGEGKSITCYTKSREIFSSCAGAAIYRKSILNEIGYFDENFFAYMEDVDISYRALINGYKNVYCPEAICYHVGSASSGSRYNEFKTTLAPRNNIWIIYKNMPWPQILLNSLFLFMGFLIKYLFFVKKGLGKTYIRSLKSGVLDRNKLNKIKYDNKNFKNYLKIEWLLIKNLIKYPFI